jgi:hypothetical protein
MCGHLAGTNRGVIHSPQVYVRQFEDELLQYDDMDVEVVSVYNSGSMLNPHEIPPDALFGICRKISDMAKFRKVVFETRPEFVKPEYISEIKKCLGAGITLTLAMGLETADDTIRELCINKGCTTSEIGQAVETAHRFGETQLYVLYGIPFLTESEAVEDTVAALKKAKSLNADEIHIEPMTIQRHTIMEALSDMGLYRLPSLYGLFYILHRTVPTVRPYISPFMHMPLPLKIPRGCDACTDTLLHILFKKYNVERSARNLDYPECSCIGQWRARCRKQDSRILEKRVEDALYHIFRQPENCEPA